MSSSCPGSRQPWCSISGQCVHLETSRRPETHWRCWQQDRTSDTSTPKKDLTLLSWRARGWRQRRASVRTCSRFTSKSARVDVCCKNVNCVKQETLLNWMRTNRASFTAALSVGSLLNVMEHLCPCRYFHLQKCLLFLTHSKKNFGVLRGGSGRTGQ